MAGRKRPFEQSSLGSYDDSSSSSSADTTSKKARRHISLTTFNKWKSHYDSDHQTLTWLNCDCHRGDVKLLWCSVCRDHKSRICGMTNFSEAWITGSENHRSSNLIDHANSEQHKAAMSRHRVEQAKSHNQPITTIAPIAKSLLTLGGSEKIRLQRSLMFAT